MRLHVDEQAILHDHRIQAGRLDVAIVMVRHGKDQGMEVAKFGERGELNAKFP